MFVVERFYLRIYMINFQDFMFIATLSVLGLSLAHAVNETNTQAIYLSLACVVANFGWWMSQ